ncbi:oxidation resistance protein 1 [[Candida] anglica]|uniref:Oxidation resistance protein 1 n=1 Tax=[Candida] anglica TaxID=148631 RepID=A0ABP0EJJ2_9ASCO
MVKLSLFGSSSSTNVSNSSETENQVDDNYDRESSPQGTINSEKDSLKETYSRLSKRSTLLERLRNNKKGSESPTLSPSNSSSTSSLALPPLTPLSLHGYKSSTKHKLLDKELAENIRNLVPARFQLFDDWYLEYSLEQHGISLKTLYNNCNPDYQRNLKRKQKQESGFADSVVSSMVITTSNSSYSNKRPHGYIMIIKDETNAKFGCFLNENLKPMEHKRYYGNGECFLWKVETFDPRTLSHHDEKLEDEESTPISTQTRFKAFMYTGINDNLIYSDSSFIAIGSSDGQNGLWIDKSLYKGVSCPCDTFGNEILNGQHSGKIGRFKIMGLEVWRIGDYNKI